MARVFHICFHHKGKSFSALVSVNGKDDSSVRVTTNNEFIQIVLPTGKLSFAIADVLHRLYASPENKSKDATLYITENISMQLITAED